MAVLEGEVPHDGSCSSGQQEECAFGLLGGGSLTDKRYLYDLKVNWALPARAGAVVLCG